MFWYPWGKEAIDRAFVENKPILLSIGYSTCYWCHVMEREVFENLSIASQMNKSFINIKVDREEHPELDEIYLVARQLMTQEGGWPNNVFLTPDLKPFYAGGTYAADDSYGRPAFPRLLEWLNYSWVTQEQTVRNKANEIAEIMQPFLVFSGANETNDVNILESAKTLFETMCGHHDERSGGFFQAPKFPHECYLHFLLNYYEATADVKALDVVTATLGKMAAGGIYDQVGCGFHRYAVDKEWYVPHFEKMLYNQALLADIYTRAAVYTGNSYFSDVAKGILDFTAGPLRDGTGAFYSAIDAETDHVEGAYYAWTAEELQSILTPEETQFFTMFYALADIPAFPGHRHANGQVIIARKPLDLAAREFGKPYIELAALSAQVMNKILDKRNARKAPHLDDKIIVSWNGLMLAAYARAGKALGVPRYLEIARKAASYLLENAFDNEGNLRRVVGSQAELAATLEDYAYLIEGLIALYKAEKDVRLTESIESLISATNVLFFDQSSQGYFYTQQNSRLIFRIKTPDDGTLPNANAVMAQNLLDMYEVTGNDSYRHQAQSLIEYYMRANTKPQLDYACMLASGLKLHRLLEGTSFEMPQTFSMDNHTGMGQPLAVPDDVVNVSVNLFPADVSPGENCEVIITIELKDGWHINANQVSEPYLVPTQLDVQAEGVHVVEVIYPQALRRDDFKVFEGMVNITVRLRLSDKLDRRPPFKIMVRFQPCHGTTCHKIQDISITA